MHRIAIFKIRPEPSAWIIDLGLDLGVVAPVLVKVTAGLLQVSAVWHLYAAG